MNHSSPRRGRTIKPARLKVSYIGHSSVLIELDGLRLLTDPVLRGRVLHIVREAPAVDLEAIGKVDLVVSSRTSTTITDPASLRMISNGAELIVPQMLSTDGCQARVRKRDRAWRG